MKVKAIAEIERSGFKLMSDEFDCPVTSAIIVGIIQLGIQLILLLLDNGVFSVSKILLILFSISKYSNKSDLEEEKQ